MIEVLLSYNVEVGDALLHAITEENVEAVELLLNHEVATKGEEVILYNNILFRGLLMTMKTASGIGLPTP